MKITSKKEEGSRQQIKEHNTEDLFNSATWDQVTKTFHQSFIMDGRRYKLTHTREEAERLRNRLDEFLLDTGKAQVSLNS